MSGDMRDGEPYHRRRVSFLLPGEPLCCPDGHAIPTDQWAWPHGGVRCRHRVPPGTALCGVLVYWLAIPGGTRVLCEVSSAELHHMEQARMDADAVRDYLRLKWARPARVLR